MKTQDAIEFFGSRKAIADALGIWPQSVYNWGDEVPPLRAYQLREIMDKKLHKMIEEANDFAIAQWPCNREDA
jgi:hypothetical protein